MALSLDRCSQSLNDDGDLRVDVSYTAETTGQGHIDVFVDGQKIATDLLQHTPGANLHTAIVSAEFLPVGESMPVEVRFRES